MNILLVSVDCLRADYIDPDITPNIWAFKQRAIDCQHCYSNGTKTVDAVQNLVSSSFRSHHGGDGLAPEQVPVSEVLTETHRTGLFHSNPNIREERGYHCGIDEVYDFDTIKTAKENISETENSVKERLTTMARRLGMTRDSLLWELGKRPVNALFNDEDTVEYQPYADAEETFNEFLQWRASSQGSYFAWIHLMDPHLPYTIREEFFRDAYRDGTLERIAERNFKRVTADGVPIYEFSAEEQTAMRRLYRAEVQYTDAQFGRLVEAVDEGETAVLLTADHGEYLFEYDFKFGHHCDIWDELVRVPFIVAVPGHEPATRTRSVSLLDVSPTVADIADRTPPDTYRGTSVLSAVEDRPVLGERIEDGPQPYLVYCQYDGVRSGYYPGKDHWIKLREDDIYSVRPAVLPDRVINAVRAHLNAGVETASTTADPSPEIQDRLEALGYKQS